MIKANVKYFGKDTDEFGMPNEYHSYLVIASPWESKDSGIASVISLSTAAPMPNSQHVLSTKGGEEEAYNKMILNLQKLTTNQRLTELIDKE